MQIADILNQIVFDAGDETSAYRNVARTWLNLVRAELYELCHWRQCLNARATFATDASTPSGIYDLDGFERIAGRFMFDTTNNNTLRYESREQLESYDPDKSTEDNPAYWCDAGMSSAGAMRVFLYPIPTSVLVIRFAGYRSLVELTDQDETLTVDPTFGRVLDWSAVLKAGVAVHAAKHDNAQPGEVGKNEAWFNRLVRQKRKRNELSTLGSLDSQPAHASMAPAKARLDPARFETR